jgi:hypothetical protein
MPIETGRVRVTFRVTAQETLDDTIDVFEWRDEAWVFLRGISVVPMPHLHEAEIVALIREGKPDEIESHRYPEPMTVVVNYVDQMLKGMGWCRVSELHTFPLDNPMRPGSNPNRVAVVDVRRGWRERRYLSAVDRIIRAQRDS